MLARSLLLRAKGLQHTTTQFIISPSQLDWNTPTAYFTAAHKTAVMHPGKDRSEKAMNKFREKIEKVLNRHNGAIQWEEALRVSTLRRKMKPDDKEFLDALPTIFTFQGQHRAAIFNFALCDRFGWDRIKAGELAGDDLLEDEPEEEEDINQPRQQLAERLLAPEANVTVSLFACPAHRDAAAIGLRQHESEPETKG